jgi:predicted solute-binding protein
MFSTLGKAIDVDEDYIVYRESTAGGQSGGPIIVKRG